MPRLNLAREARLERQNSVKNAIGEQKTTYCTVMARFTVTLTPASASRVTQFAMRGMRVTHMVVLPVGLNVQIHDRLIVDEAAYLVHEIHTMPRVVTAFLEVVHGQA
jgi:hypothetical protein